MCFIHFQLTTFATVVTITVTQTKTVGIASSLQSVASGTVSVTGWIG